MSFYDAIRVGASGAAGFEVERSLRFNSGDSPELTRTPSGAGSRTTWTLSFWAKISDDDLGSHGFLFSTGADSSNKVQINLESSNRITFEAKSGGSTQAYIRPSNNLRDISAWYHFLVLVNTTHASSDNRLIIYINGEDTRSNLANSTYPSQNTEFEWNKAQEHNIGKRTYSSNYFNGYLAEINFIDGTALFADSFTETDSITGQLIPKKYTGSYGTNGFYLNFSDNSGTTATTLGKDSSGNGNNFTPNNFSVSAGTGNDSLEDTPTNNFPTLNPLNSRVPDRLSNGNLDIDYTNGDDNAFAAGSFGMKSGKWYFEVTLRGDSSSMGASMIGISPDSYQNLKRNNVNAWGGYESGSGIGFNGNNEVYYNGSSTGYGGTWATNDIIGIAVDADLGKVAVSKNGQFSNGSGSYNQGSTIIDAANKLITNATKVATDAPYFVSLADTSGAQDPKFSINFGQRAFSYTPPTGYKKLCSSNLPDPTILLPNNHFDTLLWSGDSANSRDITGLNFKPDWVWIKCRNYSSYGGGLNYNHVVWDALRGPGSASTPSSNAVGRKELTINENYSEGSTSNYTNYYGHVSAFNSDGFTLGKVSGEPALFTNLTGRTYVGWNWNAGDTDGKTYTVKVVSDSGNKYRFDDFGTSAVTLDLAEGGTYIFDQSDSSNAGHPLRFSTTSNGTHGGGSEYTTGVTTAGTPGSSGAYTQIVVAASAPTLYYYCSVHSGMGGQANTNSTLGSSNFDGSIQSTAKVNATAGFSITKYTGTGSSTTVGHSLGVKPDSIIIKRRDAVDNWMFYHKGVNSGVDPEDYYLELNSNGSQVNSTAMLNDTAPTSTSVTIGSDNSVNGSSATYIMYCFSEVAGYSKFGSYQGNGSSDGSFVFTGFSVRWLMVKRTDDTDNWSIYDTARDTTNVMGSELFANVSNAEQSNSSDIDFVSNGFKFRRNYTSNNGSGTFIYLAFAEAPFRNARAR